MPVYHRIYMEIQNIQRDRTGEDRSVSLSIRTTKKGSEYMKKQNVSPTKLFNESLKDLMKKNPIRNKKAK